MVFRLKCTICGADLPLMGGDVCKDCLIEGKGDELVKEYYNDKYSV